MPKSARPNAYVWNAARMPATQMSSAYTKLLKIIVEIYRKKYSRGSPPLIYLFIFFKYNDITHMNR